MAGGLSPDLIAEMPADYIAAAVGITAEEAARILVRAKAIARVMLGEYAPPEDDPEPVAEETAEPAAEETAEPAAEETAEPAAEEAAGPATEEAAGPATEDGGGEEETREAEEDAPAGNE